MARTLIVTIIGDASSLQKSLTDSDTAAAGFGSRLGSLAKTAALALGAGALGGLALVLDKSVSAALSAQASQASLDAALKATGQSVTVMTPALDAATAAARNLGFGNDDTRDSLSKLEIATGSTTSAINDLGVAEDLARFKHESLTAASQTLSMAMTGSQRAVKQLGITVPPVTTNLDALKTSGVDLTSKTGQLQAAHAKLADTMLTSQAIIAAVTDKVHGQADAFAGTAAGGMATFRAGLENIEEEIGNALLPILESAVSWVNSNWPQIQQVFQTVFAAMGQAINTVKPIFTAVVNEAGNLLSALGGVKGIVGPLAIAVGVLAAGWAAYEVAVGIATVATTAWAVAEAIMAAATLAGEVAVSGLTIAVAAFDAIPLVALIVLIVGAIAALVVGIVELIEHFGAVEQGFSDAFNFIVNLAGTVVTAIINFFSPLVGKLDGFFTTIGNFISGVWGTISTDASKLVSDVAGFFTALPGNIHTALNDVAGWVKTNVWDKISSTATSLITAIGGFFTGLPGDIHKALSDIAGWVKTNVWDKLSSDASGTVSAISGFFGGLPGDIANFAEKVGSTFVDKLSDGLSTLGAALLRLIKAPINAIISAWDGIGFDFTLPSIHVPLVGTFGGGSIDFHVPQIQQLDVGGHILSDGIAMVHKGEHVVPAGGALAGAAAGGTTTINNTYNMPAAASKQTSADMWFEQRQFLTA